MSGRDWRRFTSHAFQLASLVVLAEGVSAVVDPGYFPDEIVRVRRAATSGGRRVELCLVTHGDFDHVAGVAAFPEALVVAHERIADPELSGRNLSAWRAFDAELYVERADRRMPRPDVQVAGPTRLRLAGREIWAVPTPGHSPDHLAFFFPAWGVAHLGDMLSALEFPFVDGRPRVYLESLETVEARLQAHAIRTAVVGHGPPAGATAVARRLRRDRAYLWRLEAAETGEVPSTGEPWWGERAIPAALIPQHLRNLEVVRGGKAGPGPTA